MPRKTNTTTTKTVVKAIAKAAPRYRFYKPSFVTPETVEPRQVKRDNNNKRVDTYSWADIARALRIDRSRMIEFFEKVGIVEVIHVGGSLARRITMNKQFSDLKCGETYFACSKMGQQYSQSVVFRKGLSFIKNHYLQALLHLTNNPDDTT